MAGLVLFARAGVDGSYLRDVLPSMALLGIGAGIAFPALMAVAMSGATPADAGLASGLVNTTAQVGGALGLAVLATLADSRSRTLSRHGLSAAAALTGGYHLAFWIAAALVACAIAIVVRGAAAPRPGRRPRTARPARRPPPGLGARALRQASAAAGSGLKAACRDAETDRCAPCGEHEA